jgi:hypothetical protein
MITIIIAIKVICKNGKEKNIIEVSNNETPE